MSLSPEEKLAKVQALTNRWLQVLEKEINRQIGKKGVDRDLVFSACMSAASRLVVLTILQYDDSCHGAMFENFSKVALACYHENIKARGPQIIVPGRSLLQ